LTVGVIHLYGGCLKKKKKKGPVFNGVCAQEDSSSGNVQTQPDLLKKKKKTPLVALIL